MKKYTNTQAGSGHTVLIVLLVVVLLGLLGFIFYQNFMTKKDTTPTTSQETLVQKPEITTAQMTLGSNVYEVTHLKSWAVKTESDPQPETNRIVLTSPTEKTKVTLSVTEGGMGGACDTASPLKVRFYNVHKNAVTNLGKVSAYIVESISDADGGGYNYLIGLTEDGGATHAAVGDSHCTVTYVGLASRMIVNGATVTQPTVMTKIEFPSVGENGKVKEMQPVKDMIATDEYKEAVAILESAYKK